MKRMCLEVMLNKLKYSVTWWKLCFNINPWSPFVFVLATDSKINFDKMRFNLNFFQGFSVCTVSLLLVVTTATCILLYTDLIF